MQPCHLCGIVFDMDSVPNNPFKRCPNPACGAPLDAEAAAHVFTEASNPSDKKDTQRAAAQEQLQADVARHQDAATSARDAISRLTGPAKPATPPEPVPAVPAEPVPAPPA